MERKNATEFRYSCRNSKQEITVKVIRKNVSYKNKLLRHQNSICILSVSLKSRKKKHFQKLASYLFFFVLFGVVDAFHASSLSRLLERLLALHLDLFDAHAALELLGLAEAGLLGGGAIGRGRDASADAARKILLQERATQQHLAVLYAYIGLAEAGQQFAHALLHDARGEQAFGARLLQLQLLLAAACGHTGL